MSRSDVPRYSRVPEAFWVWAASWPDEMKFAALYFMTSKHRTLEGIFLLPVGYAMEDLHWPAKKISKAIAFLTEAAFLRFDLPTNTMLLRDALTWQAPENDNQATSCLRRIANLPSSVLLQEFLVLAKQHCYRKGASPFAQSFYQRLEQQLTQQLQQRLGEPLSPLNLNLTSSTLTKPKSYTSHLQPRRSGAGRISRNVVTNDMGNGRESDSGLTKIDPGAALEAKWPHLKETS